MFGDIDNFDQCAIPQRSSTPKPEPHLQRSTHKTIYDLWKKPLLSSKPWVPNPPQVTFDAEPSMYDQFLDLQHGFQQLNLGGCNCQQTPNMANQVPYVSRPYSYIAPFRAVPHFLYPNGKYYAQPQYAISGYNLYLSYAPTYVSPSTLV